IELKYEGILMEILNELGEMPLPPYIKEALQDQDRYQTVYAEAVGSAAAPTAGLHFTESLLTEIKNKGVNLVFVTLHVGLGTFRPVTSEDFTEHDMHAEYYIMSEESAEILNQTKLNNKRIIAVGTTSTRVLESNVNEDELFEAKSGWTDIFVDRENILKTYKIAVNENYRFYSFGDAMLIL